MNGRPYPAQVIQIIVNKCKETIMGLFGNILQVPGKIIGAIEDEIEDLLD